MPRLMLMIGLICQALYPSLAVANAGELIEKGVQLIEDGRYSLARSYLAPALQYAPTAQLGPCSQYGLSVGQKRWAPKPMIPVSGQKCLGRHHHHKMKTQNFNL